MSPNGAAFTECMGFLPLIDACYGAAREEAEASDSWIYLWCPH